MTALKFGIIKMFSKKKKSTKNSDFLRQSNWKILAIQACRKSVLRIHYTAQAVIELCASRGFSNPVYLESMFYSSVY